MSAAHYRAAGYFEVAEAPAVRWKPRPQAALAAPRWAMLAARPRGCIGIMKQDRMFELAHGQVFLIHARASWNLPMGKLSKSRRASPPLPAFSLDGRP
jgi:hypothetical protein